MPKKKFSKFYTYLFIFMETLNGMDNSNWSRRILEWKQSGRSSRERAKTRWIDGIEKGWRLVGYVPLEECPDVERGPALEELIN